MVDEPAGDPDDPSSLVRRATQGDEHALARIVRLHHVPMTRACFVVAGDREAAAAAVAASWPAVLERLGALENPGRLAPWLCAVAVEQVVRPGAAGISFDAGAGGAPGDDRRWPDGPPASRDTDLARELSGLATVDRGLLALRYVARLGPAELRRLAWVPEPGPEGELAVLRGRLAPALGLAGLGEADVDAAMERRLGAYSAITVHPIDADATAGVARDDLRMRRSYVLSVAIALAAAALLIASMYLLAAGSPR